MLVLFAILVGLVVVTPAAAAITQPARHPAPRDGLDRVAEFAAATFVVVGLCAFYAFVAAAPLFGNRGVIVGLTTVHFTFAGVGTLALARRARATHRTVGDIATVATITAPPVVALGFLVHHPLPQVGGAVLMSVGALAVATAHLREARRGRHGSALLAISGLAPWAAMVLAVFWAAGNYWGVPALSIPDMVRTHGIMNMVFVLAGLAGRWAERRVPASEVRAVPA